MPKYHNDRFLSEYVGVYMHCRQSGQGKVLNSNIVKNRLLCTQERYINHNVALKVVNLQQ